MTDLTEGHIVKRFDGELFHIHQYVLEMGGLVLDHIARSVRALDAEDPDAAREIIARDRTINDLDVKADEEIVRLLALRQPMASDLRVVMTIAKSVTDLERVGDETRKIANLVIRLYDNDGVAPNKTMLRDINAMAKMASRMLRQSIEAFDQLDLKRALEVIRQDLELEDEFESSLRRLATFLMEDSRTVGHAIEITLGLRAIERIGGHAKNIAGYVFYLATAKDVRHLDLPDLAKLAVA